MPELQFISFTPSELLTKRTHARIARDVLRRLARHHIQVRMAKHYQEVPETAPGGAYGYARRSPRYLDRKRKRFGHEKPNVFTGRERNYVRNTARITGTQHRSRLYLLRLHTRRQELSDQHGRELAAFSPAEALEMRDQAHGWYAEEANRPENRRKRAPKQTI